VLARQCIRLGLVMLASVALNACATWPERPEIRAELVPSAQVPGFERARLWSDAAREEWERWRAISRVQRYKAGRFGAYEILAISSGSDKGAFSAGFLNGWSKAGNRPEFDIVSGVSTGALIAPFAFLGSGYDAHLTTLYTGIEAHHIYKARPIAGLLGGAALADTQPLADLIALYTDEELLARIAAEHAKGRRLLVQTTNLDAERGVVWDMGAIASSKSAERLTLFRRVLLASASIPGAFPPVLIRSQNGSSPLEELHVDGGTTSSLFAVPPAIVFESMPDRDPLTGRITILYNGALAPNYEVTKPRTFSILERALSASIREADRRSISALNAFAEKNGIEIEVHPLGPTDEEEKEQEGLFDPAFMLKVYKKGEALGLMQASSAKALDAP